MSVEGKKSSAARTQGSEEQSHPGAFTSSLCNFAEINANFLDCILLISLPDPFQTQSRDVLMQKYECSSNFLILPTYGFQVGIFKLILCNHLCICNAQNLVTRAHR